MKILLILVSLLLAGSVYAADICVDCGELVNNGSYMEPSGDGDGFQVNSPDGTKNAAWLHDGTNSVFNVSSGVFSFLDDIELESTKYFGWSDARFYRDGAGILALRNGTAAQQLRIYNTDNGADDEYARMGWTSDSFVIGTKATGTGTQRPTFVDGSSVILQVASANQWAVNTNDIRPSTDNAETFGIDTLRPSTIFTYAIDIGAAGASTTITSTGENKLTLSGVLYTAIGSASLPAYSFTGDPDTGFYTSGPGRVNLSLNGTEYYEFSTGSLKLTNASTELQLAAASITVGSGTGLTVNDTGSVRHEVYKVTLDYTGLSAAALTAVHTIGTLPAGMKIVGIIADTTIQYAGTGVTDADIEVGISGGTTNAFLASHDVDTALFVAGDIDAELGTLLIRSAAVSGGYIDWASTTVISVQITTVGADTDALIAGSTTYYIETVQIK